MALDDEQIRKIGVCCTIAAVAAFTLGTMVSAMYFPAFSLSSVWTSDLGDYGRNPQGALFYNAGGALAGLLSVPFARSIRRWYDGGRGQKFFYDLAMHFGLLVSVALFMQAVFPRGTDLHSPWSTVGLFSMAFVLLFANAMLFRNLKFYRPIGYYGIVSLLVLLAFFALYAPGWSPVIVEWTAVFSYFLWTVMLSINGLKASVAQRQVAAMGINTHRPI